MTIDPQLPTVYAFGRFRLDPAARVLTRDGEPVPLFPKVLETLIVLVESGGGIVSKEDLMARVWPDTFVQESNLTQNIFLLRKLLGEDWIETVPRRGYRFTSQVSAVAEEVLVSHRTSVRIVSQEVSEEPSRMRWIAGGAVVIALAAGGFAVRERVRQDRPAAAPVVTPRFPTLVRLTHDSRAYDPAISPDGRFVAYAVARDGEKSVWLRDISGGSATEVMPPSRFDYRGLVIAPDGHTLFYKTHRDGETNGLIMRAPLLGGASQEIARDVWSDFAVSPDGSEVAFVRSGVRKGATMAVMVARADGTGERKVAESIHAKTWFALWDSAPAWSPDGRRLALCGWSRDSDGDHPRLYEIEVASGATRQINLPKEWTTVSQVAWLGSGFIVVASSQLWLLDSSGAARRMTSDTNEYRKFKLSADGKLLVVEQQLPYEHLWVLPGADAARARQVTFGTNDGDGYSGLAWTAEGRLLFISDRSGENEIWSMRADGSDVRQITTNSPKGNASVGASPDGRFLVFVSARSGRSNVWRVDADGRNPRQLTRLDSVARPQVSPDGRWVYYVNQMVPLRIERVPIEGGAAIVLPSEGATGGPAVSPDGRLVAFDHYDEERGWRNGVMPAAGGPMRFFPWHSNRGIVRWTPDSRALLFIRDSNVWRQPLDGSAPAPVTAFPAGEPMWNFALSPDGRDLAVVRGGTLSDIVLIGDFR